MSAHPLPGEEEACRAAGMQGYLAKPLRASALFEIIQREVTPPGQRVPAAAPTPLVFDKSGFLSRLEGDELLGGEIIELFLHEYPKLLEGVRQAVGQRSASLLERAAHSLKGSIGDIAAPQAFDAARTLEEMAREGKVADTGGALTSLEGALDRLVHELRNPEKKALLYRPDHEASTLPGGERLRAAQEESALGDESPPGVSLPDARKGKGSD